MMRLRSHASTDDELGDGKSLAHRPDRTGVPLKAQKLLGQKGHLAFNIEESIVISGGTPYVGGIDVPPKAQKILGERAKVRAVRIQDGKHADPDSVWHVRDAERQRGVRSSDRASHAADSDTLPGRSKVAALSHYPVALRSSEDVRPSSNSSTVPTATSSWGTHNQPSVESLSREYYDSTKQHSFVSQQTSESSVRDMALRKGVATTHDSSSETRLTTPGSRHSSTRQFLPDGSVNGGISRQQKKTGLRSLLPHGRSETRASGSRKLTRPPPASSPASSESFSRNGAKGRRVESRPPNEPNKFHSDVYDNRKTHVRRPPRGIKNWFDGFDISSGEDDEEEAAPAELPAPESSKNDIARPQEGLPSVFSLYTPPKGESEELAYVNHKVPPARSSSLTYKTRPVYKQQKARKNSLSSNTAESASSGNVDGRKRSGESRLARSRLGAQSVLSLSSGSNEDLALGANRDSVGNSTIVDGRAQSLDLHRMITPSDAPSSQAVTEQSAEPAKVRRSNSHSPGLRSNNLRDSSINYTSTPAIPSRESGSMLSGSSSRRWQYGWNGFSQHRPNVHSPYERDGGESAGGETSSSVPTDASRLMAVTEEEMILLELMRQKRAAMQKHSFAEGYKLARRQGERLHHTRISDPASDPSLLTLKRRGGSRMPNRGVSRTESLIREEIEQRKRLSALRKEEVDKAFKIGRFLEMESPGEDASSRLDRFLVMAPGLAEDFNGRPISGTEIEIDSRYGDQEEMQSSFDEERFPNGGLGVEPETEQSMNQSDTEHAEESGEARTPPLIVSPMQRLTNQVQRTGIDAAVAQMPDAAHLKRNGTMTSATLSGSKDGIVKDASRLDVVSARSPIHAATNGVAPSRSAPSLPAGSQGLAGEDDQQTSVDSPDTPVATTWARPTSLKHPRPQRQQPLVDFTPLERSNSRRDDPRATLKQMSPIGLPVNAATNPLGVGSQDMEKIASTTVRTGSCTDNASVSDRLSPQTHGSGGSERSRRAVPPPRIDTSRQVSDDRIPSTTSVTSAGEDVLAAWAELGGSEFKRKKDW